MATPLGTYFYIGKKQQKPLKQILFINHSGCIDFWHGASLGQGNSSLFK